MKIIYAWVILLLIVIAGVAFFINRIYTKTSQPAAIDLAKIRTNFGQEYEKKAEVLSDSALILAEQLKAEQGSLTPEQELKIKNLLDRAKTIKENVARLKNENLGAYEGEDILRACASVYGQASYICNQLRAEVGE